MQVDELHAGEVGWLSASIRAVADARVGDTITLKGKQGAQQALPGAGTRDPEILNVVPTSSLKPSLKAWKQASVLWAEV